MSNLCDHRPIRPRRSVLYVPAGNGRALEKSLGLDADAVIYDLEDSTPPEGKAEAREALAAFFRAHGRDGGGIERIIRINALSSPFGTEDLMTARGCRPDAILLPKVSRVEDVREVEAALGEMDAPESLRLWAMIETPLGVLDAGRIAMEGRRPDARLDAFVAGTNDLVKETGVSAGAGRVHLRSWLMQIVLAARAGGLDAIDGVYNDFRDADGFRRECEAGAAMGFDGKSLIHPAQLAPANAAFDVDAEALADAKAVAAAFARPENAAKGVIALHGRMVERLHLDSARRLIARAEAIAKRRDGP